jgi:hypothetical protein
VNRFHCPACQKSLRFRLLRHVSSGRDGEPMFSCLHCRAVLGYNKGPIDALLWGTGFRTLATLVSAWTLLCFIFLELGFRATLGAVAVLAVALVAIHGFSARPAYRLPRAVDSDKVSA